MSLLVFAVAGTVAQLRSEYTRINSLLISFIKQFGILGL